LLSIISMENRLKPTCEFNTEFITEYYTTCLRLYFSLVNKIRMSIQHLFSTRQTLLSAISNITSNSYIYLVTAFPSRKPYFKLFQYYFPDYEGTNNLRIAFWCFIFPTFCQNNQMVMYKNATYTQYYIISYSLSMKLSLSFYTLMQYNTRR